MTFQAVIQRNYLALLVLTLFVNTGLCLSTASPLDIPSDNPLVEACRVGDIDKATQLIRDGVNVNVYDQRGFFALKQAVCRNNVALTNMLLEEGADVNLEDLANHETPIGCSQTEEMAFLLLRAGANILRKTGPSRIPTVDILFINAAAQGWMRLLQMVRPNITSLQVTTYSSYTALMAAARSNQVEVVRALLKWGANVNHADDRGETALMSAAFEGNTDTLRVLLDVGADPNRTMDGGENALSLTVIHCWNPAPAGSGTTRGDVLAATQLLLEAGAKIEGRVLKLLRDSPYISSGSICESQYDVLQNYRQK